MTDDLFEQDTELNENEIIANRREKLQNLRENNIAFRNDFYRDSLASNLLQQFNGYSASELETMAHRVKVAGRIMLRRLMGKASFVHIQDMSGRLQLYIKKENLIDDLYEQFKKWDLGDIIGAEGTLFKTKTGELSVKVDQLFLLTKSLRPLPDKFHGLHDTEQRYRQRYLDLMVNEKSRQTFLIRSKLIVALRQFLQSQGFLEVETPMMQLIPGGAAARPFITYHNALDMQLYLRVAPELFLKRLVVGGFEKVFEINRNFRNEGVSTQHNPEFTMLEFYQSYATYHDLIDLTELMLRTLSQHVLGTTTVSYQGHDFDLSKPFKRMTMLEAILHFNPEINTADLSDENHARRLAKRFNIPLKDSYGLGKIQLEIFEKTAEHKLIEPTFITAYPIEVSPLSRRNDHNPFLADRFEFFIAGSEIANGFSELNDPDDQAERFRQQALEKAAGDFEAMEYDEDYITALEYGLPPTAGEGIGIDRLVMFFTDSPSIRDVLLFPYMRKKE